MQLYIDKREKTACLNFLFPCRHMPSLEDLSPFLEGGCCRAGSLSWLKTQSPHNYADVPLVEFMHLVFTRMPGESYRRRLTSLLLCGLCDHFRALINSLVC